MGANRTPAVCSQPRPPRIGAAYAWTVAHLIGAERIRLEVPTRIVLDDLSLGLETGDQVEVISGVRGGERIVVEGPATLKDGDKVKVQ